MEGRQISRVRRTKTETKAYYDQLSSWYDLLAGWGEQKCKDAGLQKLAVKNTERVLEIGFGTGMSMFGLPVDIILAKI